MSGNRAGSCRGSRHARLADASFACVENGAGWHFQGERIACPDLDRLRNPIALAVLLALAPFLVACGSSSPDPADVLDRALTRENLSDFGNGPDGPVGGVVTVQALGFEDRVLDERKVGASAAVMSQIREALGADPGCGAWLTVWSTKEPTWSTDSRSVMFQVIWTSPDLLGA